MIVFQTNGYRDIRVTLTDHGVTLDNGVHYPDGTFKVEQTVSLTEGDREIIVAAFAAGLPKEHTRGWDLADGRKLQICGQANGNMGDWNIWQGKERVLRGSFNLEGLTKALLRPFKEMLFMGAGERSIRQTKELLMQVEGACGLLSGVQQCFTGPDHDPEGASKGEQEIQEVVRSVAMALTGKEIDFK